MRWFDLILSIFASALFRRLRPGDSCRAVASRFDLAVSTVVKWGQRYRKTGSVAPGKYGGHKRHSLEPHRALVHRLVAARPDQPVRELRGGPGRTRH